MVVDWKHLSLIIGSLLGVVGPYVGKLATFHDLLTPTGLGGLCVVIGAWFVALSTYSWMQSPLGGPKQP